MESLGFLILEFLFTQVDSKDQSMLKALFYIDSHLQKSLKHFSERNSLSQATHFAGPQARVQTAAPYHMCK